MKKKRLGFTLIELLSTIVILAIISFIAVPTMVGVIDKAKKNAASQSTIRYIDAIESKIQYSSMKDGVVYEDKEYTFDEIAVDVKGNIPTAGIYELEKSMVTSATFCINGYAVTYQNDNAIAGDKCTAEEIKLNSYLRISKNSVFLTYPDTDMVQITENKSGGEVTCLSSDSAVATCEIDGSNVIIRSGTKEGQSTITLTSHGNGKYKDANAAILVATEAGLLSITSNDYNGVYDGNPHGITVSSSGAMIKYSTNTESYDLDESPTFTDVGTYTVYYEVTRAGYNTVRGSKTVTITKAEGEVELESSSGSISYDSEDEINITTSTGELSASVADNTVASASIVDGKLVVRGLKVGTTAITVSSASTNNYNEASTNYDLTVVKANNILVLSSSHGTVTYPNSTTFEVTSNPSGGTLSCESSNTSAATCSVSGSIVTVTPGTTATENVVITIRSAATSNYNAGQAAYVVTSENGLMTVNANGYSGVYDGNAHGISVTSTDATIKYGTTSGTYNLNQSPTYTNVGTYTVYYEVTRAGYTTVTNSKTVTITKANGSVNAPTAKTLTYNDSAQELINAGSSSTGTVYYKVGTGTYSTSIPKATDAGTYTVYYKVVGDVNHDDVAEDSISVTISKATLNYTASGYTGTYDGAAHGITVTSSGATIKYGTTSGTYNLNSSPTYTDAGTYTVYYQITRTGYNTVSESKTVTINKANNILALSSNYGTVTYPDNGTFEVTSNPSGGALTCESSNTAAATCSISGNTVTVTPGTTAAENVVITIRSAATNNYNAGQAAYVVTSENGLMTVNANGYSGVYDAAAHGITVSSSGATIKYGTTSGTYNLNSSPTYTNVGTYTVYYQVTRAGYTTVTNSKTVTITKANGSVTAPTAKTPTYTGSAQNLINAGSSSTGTVYYKVGSGTYSTSIPTATNAGTYTVYYKVVGDSNHNDVAEKSISVTISKATLNYTASDYTGTYDAAAHGISVTSSGATIKYGTTSGTYNLNSSPTYTNAGTYTVYYKITKANYNDVTGSKTVTINKANGGVTLSANSGTITYPNKTTFTVNSNTSGGTLSCTSSNEAAATCSISGTTVTVTAGTTAANNVTITVTSAQTTNYNSASATYLATSKLGTLSVTANGYQGAFDGNAHGITVTSSGATIKYGTKSGTYNLTSSPTYTDVGTYTVYYQVSKSGYTTVKDSKTVKITSLTAGSVTYTNNGQTTVQTALDDLFNKFN